MASTKKRHCAIVGVGEPKYETIDTTSNYMELCLQSAKAALADSGLTKKDLDGLIFMRRGDIPLDFGTTFIEQTGLAPAYVDTYVGGGMPACSPVFRAAWAINSGLAHNVLIVRGSVTLSKINREGLIKFKAQDAFDMQWEMPYGVFPPVWFGLMARRHMHEYGTTSRQLAQVAVTERQNASRHPGAQMREPITVDDVLNSRIIADPLHLLDICLISNGGGAVIVTAAENARNFPKPPVYLRGYGQVSSSQYLSGTAPRLMDYGHLAHTAKQAYNMAGVKPSDISVVFPYDPSTIAVIVGLEELGFCKKGEGGAFVEAGNIGINGKLPINPHGGLHSYRHYAFTLSSTIEATRQLRHECGDRQVKNAELALVAHEGGFVSHSVLIMGRD
ncbi:MAG: thiolase family protein [Dehalococcoidales bacterium]|nr:thiolase family protein [Dehalococcoidales bacterium]